MRRPRPTNRRLVVGLLGALLLALWGFVVYWSWSQRIRVLETGSTLLEQMASAVEEQTARLFKQAETTLAVSRQWIAEHPGEDPATSPAFVSLADRLRTVSGGVLDIRVVRRDGGLFYVPRRGPQPLANVADRDYFKAQMDPQTRGLFIGNPIISRVSGKWVIPISAPVEAAGDDISVVFVAVELEETARTFEAARLKPHGSISIIRADGTFLFRVPSGVNIIGQTLAGTHSWDGHFTKALRGTYVSDGTAVGTPPKLVSFIHLHDYPIYISVAAEVDDLLAPWRRETGAMAAVAVLVSLVTITLGMVLTRAMKAQERSQREIERAHRDAQLILGAAADGICGVDGQGRVSFINPAARRMLGMDGFDPVGLDFHVISHHSRSDGSPYPSLECPVHLTLTDGRTREARHETFWSGEGTAVPVDLMVSPVVEEGAVTGAVIVFRDIGERLETEHRLHAQAEQLETSNADLEQFAYVASHDLREPLRQVASFVSLLERRYADVLDEDGREFIAYAREGAERMNQLVIDLLEFSRVGRGDQAVGPIQLTAVVEDACANLAVRIAETGARIQHQHDLPVVTGRHGDLMRLFQNLIGNALKYRHPARLPEISISAQRADGEWLVTVADNGIGIDPQFNDKIFGIFQRLHTRDKFEGTGIGLAICKKIVERMSGRIWVESQPNQGARFHMTFPM